MNLEYQPTSIQSLYIFVSIESLSLNHTYTCIYLCGLNLIYFLPSFLFRVYGMRAWVACT